MSKGSRPSQESLHQPAGTRLSQVSPPPSICRSTAACRWLQGRRKAAKVQPLEQTSRRPEHTRAIQESMGSCGKVGKSNMRAHVVGFSVGDKFWVVLSLSAAPFRPSMRSPMPATVPAWASGLAPRSLTWHSTGNRRSQACLVMQQGTASWLRSSWAYRSSTIR